MLIGSVFASSACSPSNAPDAQSDASSQESATTDAAPDAETDAAQLDAETDAATSVDASTADATAPSDASIGTGGSGGVTCASTGTVTNGSTTYRFCVVTISGVELKLVEPAMDTSAAPLRLAVYLHGDGARAHTGNTTVRLQAPWTSTHRTLYVSALAPNRCAWWLRPGFTDCAANPTDADIDRAGDNVTALRAVIDALGRAYNLDLRETLFGGSSGGAFFLTASWIPAVGDRFGGAYALMCGAHAPWSGMLSWDGANAALRSKSRLAFAYGAQDEFLSDITGGVSFYRDSMFALEETVLPNTTHCAFDHIGGVATQWSRWAP